jgi:hypothetical protein
MVRSVRLLNAKKDYAALYFYSYIPECFKRPDTVAHVVLWHCSELDPSTKVLRGTGTLQKWGMVLISSCGLHLQKESVLFFLL